MSTQFYPLTIADRREETDDCVSLAFSVPMELKEKFKFKAGQYLTLRTEIDGQEVRRSYSICSAPQDGELRVAIKRVPGGLFSTYATTQLAEGDTLESMVPTGNFTAPEENGSRIVLVAAGSGITPVFGIAKDVLQRDDTAQVTLIYGNKRTKDIIFKEAIEGLKNTYLTRFQVFHVLSREQIGADLFFGRIDRNKCDLMTRTLFNPSSVDGYYLCGPHSMVEDVRGSLTACGVDKSNIHFELFGTPVVRKESTDKADAIIRRQADLSKVSITYDDKTVTINMLDDGNHLLEAALAHGIELPYACQGGVCSTCKCKVLEGEAEMDVNYALEPEEVEAGYILSCRAHPVTEELAVTFDV